MSARERTRPSRSVFAALALPLLLSPGAALHVASSPALAASWKQPAFSASRSSFNPRETTIDAGNVASLVERWRVAGVFTKGSPVVANGRVFAANGDEMIALALDDGAELWRESLPLSPGECCGLYDPVLTPDGMVTAEVGWIGGGGTAVFDPATGVFTYDVTFHGGDINRAVHGGTVFSIRFFYGSGGPFIYLLAPYPGLVDSDFVSSGPLSGPAVRGARAFVAVGTALRTFDLTSCPDPIPSPGWCRPLWTKSLPEQVLTPVAFRSSVAVAARDGSLHVYDAANGDLSWSATVGAGIGYAPAVARRRIFVPTERGVLVAFDSRGCGAATCAPVERFRLGSPATGQPVVAGDVLYAGTKDGRIVAFPAGGCTGPACDPLLDADLGGGAIVAGPIAVDGTVIAGTADGHLVAYGLPTPG